jgi:hypothetical protein
MTPKPRRTTHETMCRRRGRATAPRTPISPDGRSTLDLFGRGFTLLGFGKSAEEAAPLLGAARERKVPMTFAAIADPQIAALYQRNHVLVRPDGHVAWRDDRMPEDALCLSTSCAVHRIVVV